MGKKSYSELNFTIPLKKKTRKNYWQYTRWKQIKIPLFESVLSKLKKRVKKSYLDLNFTF